MKAKAVLFNHKKTSCRPALFTQTPFMWSHQTRSDDIMTVQKIILFSTSNQSETLPSGN